MSNTKNQFVRKPAPARTGCAVKTGRGGLTLIDVTLAVMIIGILSAVAVPRFTDFYMRQRLSSATARFQADVNFARRQAMATTANIVLDLQPTTNTYSFSDLPDPAHPNLNYTVRLAEAPYRAEIVGTNLSSNSTTINGAGVVSQPGTVTFRCGSSVSTCEIGADGMVIIGEIQ